jgi:hypothetical protein
LRTEGNGIVQGAQNFSENLRSDNGVNLLTNRLFLTVYNTKSPRKMATENHNTGISPMEHAPYYTLYIKHVEHLAIDKAFEKDWNEIERLFAVLDEEKGQFSYGEGKWTVKEVLLHCIDAERIFSYRALRFMRGDVTNLPGYDHNAYVPASKANSRSLESLLIEWRGVRKSTQALFASAADDDLIRVGIANEYRTSVRALAYIITGHNCHHLEILKSRYGLEF